MPVELTDQLELAGRVLDAVSPRVSAAEIMAARPRLAPRAPVEQPGAGASSTRTLTVDVATPDRRPPWGPRVAIAASVVLLVGLVGVVALRRADGPTTVTPATNGVDSLPRGDAPAPDATVPLTDPLPQLNVPDGSFPADLVVRFTSSMGEFGRLWVYDSPSTEQVCFVRQGGDGTSRGCLDAETYRSGQGWSHESGPDGSPVLWGLTPTDVPVTVSVDGSTLTSDENGLWYVAVRPDLEGFTISTPTDTFEVDLVPSGVTPQTTVVEPPTADGVLPATTFDLATVPSRAPTLLQPSTLPAGLEFDTGGTVVGEASPQITLWSDDFERWYTLRWDSAASCSNSTAHTTPLGPVPNEVDQAIRQREAEIDEGSVTPGSTQQLSWCSDATSVFIDAVNVSFDNLATFGRSVEIIDADTIAIGVPDGFTAQMAQRTTSRSALVYQEAGRSLRVLSFSALDGEFDTLRRPGSGELFDLAGRRAMWVNEAQLAIEYDDHTIAYVDGTGFNEEELIGIAAALVPADPALAPPVDGNCDRLGALCG